jgi:hypothetical protein
MWWRCCSHQHSCPDTHIYADAYGDTSTNRNSNTPPHTGAHCNSGADSHTSPYSHSRTGTNAYIALTWRNVYTSEHHLTISYTYVYTSHGPSGYCGGYRCLDALPGHDGVWCFSTAF